MVMLFTWVQFPPRMLYTSRTTTVSTPSQHNMRQLETTVQLRICVMFGMNIPMRSNKRRSTGARSNSDVSKRSEEYLNPYVIVGYENTQVRTKAGEGPHPIWNEELTIPLE